MYNVARSQVCELIRSWSEKCILTLYKFLWKKSWLYYRYILLSSKKLVCFSTPPIPLQPPPQQLFSIFIECQITWILKDPWILYPGIHFDQFINEPDIVLWVIVNNPNPKHINDSYCTIFYIQFCSNSQSCTLLRWLLRPMGLLLLFLFCFRYFKLYFNFKTMMLFNFLLLNVIKFLTR